MTIYWDTSALIWFYAQNQIDEIEGFTRPHSLAEMFSALTGVGFELLLSDGTKRVRRLAPKTAETVLLRIKPRLQYVDITADEVMAGLENAQAKGVQGGRVHDLLHAIAAEKCGADELWTLDENDFVGLGRVAIKNPSH